MNRTSQTGCHWTQGLIDRYLDREISAQDLVSVEEHLHLCPDCAGRVSRQTAMRDRLRAAARNTATPYGLDVRIGQRLHAEGTAASRRNSAWLAWPVMALAAALFLSVGLSMYWQQGGLRFTEGLQERYIASLAPEVTPVMQIGLQQHVHCAVFKSMPSQWPTVEEMAQSLGSDYADLVPALERHLPAGFRVAEAHVCHYEGRYYTHLAATDGHKLISLLITKRSQGEAFENDLRAVAAEAGAPVYLSGAQRFRIAGFETRDHLVYLVSDLETNQNLATLKSLLPDVDRAVRRLEI